jgi:hypothetical protein
MPFAINGFGTAFCGQCDFRPDGSFVTTEWITAVYVPLLPFRSFRLARARQQDINLVLYRSEGYAILERLSVSWTQVFRVYGFMAFAAAWWALLVWLFIFKLDFMNGTNVPLLMFLILTFFCLMGMPLVAVLWFVRKSAANRQRGNVPLPSSR